MQDFNWREELAGLEWKESAAHKMPAGSYRHRVVVVCYGQGRQKALFYNGEHNFGAYMELITGNGDWIREGSNIVPVLPDGRLLMVVEQRPAQYAYGHQPPQIHLAGGKVLELGQFGPYSSLEFPGGALDGNEGVKIGALRELLEETEVKEGQSGKLWVRNQPLYTLGSDVALRGYLCVLFLTNAQFSTKVTNDGGLTVLALAPEEVQDNIWRGGICSAQAALQGHSFYTEVVQIMDGQINPSPGYFTQKEVWLKR